MSSAMFSVGILSVIAGVVCLVAVLLAVGTVLLSIHLHKRGKHGAMAAAIAVGTVLFCSALYYVLVLLLVGGIR